jgi:hypothetical protein
LEILGVLFRCRVSVKKKKAVRAGSGRRAAGRKEKIAGLKPEVFWKKPDAVRVEA